MDGAELIDQLEPALIAVLGDGGFDLGVDEETGAIELATDDWTLVLEDWPTGIGFLAIDDEPTASNESDLHEALTKLIGKALVPLQAANDYADGAITASLTRTSDPISNALAKLLNSDRPASV